MRNKSERLASVRRIIKDWHRRKNSPTLCEKILGTLAGYPDGVSGVALAKIIGTSPGYLYVALGRLHQREKITKQSIAGEKTKLYKIANNQ